LRSAVVAGVLAVATGVSGCTSATADQESRGASGATGVAETSTADKEVLHNAEEVLTRDCMKRRGFTYYVSPAVPRTDDRDFPYVLDDPDWAGRHGYGSDLQEEVTRLRESDPNLRYLRTLTPQRRVAAGNALHGVGPGYVEAQLPTGGTVRHYTDGCSAEAWKTLYTDIGAWYRAEKVSGNLDAVRRSLVVADPAVIDRIPSWAACMRSHGQPFGTPEAARATLPRGRTKDARQVEISRAVAEATCARSSGLSTTVKKADQVAADALDSQYRSVIQELSRIRQIAVPRAERVLAIA
jgi:hypothetical protein